jgi:hypothetical protein
MRAAFCCLLLAQLVQRTVLADNLEGTVVDSAGQPVIGARVDIATAAPKVGRGMFCPSCYLDCAKWTNTDEQGRFTIKNLNPTLKFRVLFTHPGKESLVSELTDPSAGVMKIAFVDLPAKMPAERTVRGQIVNDLGIAIAGALIEPEGAKTADRRWWGRVDGVKPAVSDSKGMFAMLLPAEFQGVDLTVTADGHAGTQAALLAPGETEHRVVVPTGTGVKGRVEHDGKPIAGLGVAVVQLERDAGGHFIQAVHATTDAQGEFVFEYLPPEQAYVIFTPIPGNDSGYVLTTKRFSAYGNHKKRDLGTLSVIPALRIAGRLTLPRGHAIPPNVKLALGRDPAWDLVSINVDEDGQFAIGGLPPETYEVGLNAEGYTIDTAALNYQTLRGNEFGLRLEETVRDLQIPLKPLKPEIRAAVTK